MSCTARVSAVARHHCYADAVKGGELSYMTLLMERELITYRSPLRLAEAVLTGHEPIPTRLVRACIAVACTACVPAVARWHVAMLITITCSEL